jgi:hypothetical protein
MAKHAKGTFEVKLTPKPFDEDSTDKALGRMIIEKLFQGDLEGKSRGSMLSAMTQVDGSAGYVAIERVVGNLHGKSGSFVLQHSGAMTIKSQQLTITVVPDSGTGQLSGLSGKFKINVEDGKHSYDFEYTLPAAP